MPPMQPINPNIPSARELAQNRAQLDETAQKVHQKGMESAQQTGDLGRKGIEQENEPPLHAEDQAVQLELPFSEEDMAHIQGMEQLKEMKRGGGPEKAEAAGQEAGGEIQDFSAQPPPLPDVHDLPKGEAPPTPHELQEEEYHIYKALSDENSSALHAVMSGRLPLSQIPEIPLGMAEERLGTLADFTMRDQSHNDSVPFFKRMGMKMGFNKEQKMMKNYDRWATMATQKMAQENPGVNVKKLYMYNLSQAILSDKDPASGKPRMESMSLSAFQYKKAYEHAASGQEMKHNPPLKAAQELDQMMQHLSPAEVGAVMAKEGELKDFAMKSVAQGRPLSQEDVQAFRASYLVDLGAEGKVDPSISAKAREYLMGMQEPEAPAGGPQPSFTGNFPGSAPGTTGPNFGGSPIPGAPGIPGIPDLNQYLPGPPPIPNIPGQGSPLLTGQGGPQAPGGWPQQPGQYPGAPVTPGGSYDSFIGALKAQERVSKIGSSIMMCLVGGPMMIPYALMMNLMPSNLDLMAAQFRPNAVPTPNPVVLPNGQTIPYSPQQPQTTFSQSPNYIPTPPMRKPPLLYGDDSQFSTPHKKPVGIGDEEMDMEEGTGA